ncbi:hypothetical protein [uncultured Tateyamaria sp.]|uniref:hypothetical protein n=1 Tax=uncultured Tateyamaria sp. TaxID=455651 RepID=UPI002607E028|nr:hypothetical protein [uncultured Tateyamaria sp.]
MSRIKTMCAAFVVMATGITQAAANNDIAFSFAECAGRFSAEMEHAWLLNDPVAQVYEQDRASFVSLTDASLAPGQGRAILGHRVEVKLAHAALLQQASFGTRADRAKTARHVANTHLATCRTLLLGS